MKRAKRVLIYRLGSLGDTLVALPSLRLVARAFPESSRRLLTNQPVHTKAPAAAAVLTGTGLVDGYFEYPVGVRSLTAIIRLWWRIVCWGPDILVYLAAARGLRAARRDRWFFLCCGIRTQIGIPDGESAQVLVEAGNGVYESEAARMSRMVAVLGDARLEDAASWSLSLTEGELHAGRSVVAAAGAPRMLAMSIGTKRQTGDWTLPNWIALAVRLGRALPGYGLILTGATDERAATEEVAAAWRGVNAHGATNVCGQLTPRETAAVYEHASVFVGHDSGPMHLAAAVGTPCVAIFSARQLPGVWFPFGTQNRILYRRVECRGCGLEVCTVEQKRCILSITPEEVEAEVLSLLKESSASTFVEHRV